MAESKSAALPLGYAPTGNRITCPDRSLKGIRVTERSAHTPPTGPIREGQNAMWPMIPALAILMAQAPQPSAPREVLRMMLRHRKGFDALQGHGCPHAWRCVVPTPGPL